MHVHDIICHYVHRYGRHPGQETLCSLCDHFNDNEKPPECLTSSTSLPIVETSPPPPTLPPTTIQEDAGTSGSQSSGVGTDALVDSTGTFPAGTLLNSNTPKQGIIDVHVV